MATREVTNSELTTAPYSAVGLIQVYWADGTVTRGTVSMVGPNDVLTATHVIYDPAHGGLAKNFDLFFGVDFNSAANRFDSGTQSWSLRAGTFAWDALRFTDRVFSDSNPGVSFSESQFDVAVIGLSTRVGDATGWFGIDPGSDFSQWAIEIGYPNNGTGMMTGDVFVERNSTYGVYTATAGGLGPGSSGGPLFTNDYYVLGVKSGGSGGVSSWADLGMVRDPVFSFLSTDDWLLQWRQPTSLQTESALAVYRAFYGVAPGTDNARDLIARVGVEGVPAYAKDLANDFAAAPADQLASLVLQDLGVRPSTLGGSNPTASYYALLDAVTSVFVWYPDARGQVVLNMTNLLAGLESDAVYGNVAVAFNDRVDADLVAVTTVGVA
ncbi:trypsin-like serine peptidase [Ramlibacter albus]|uniref:Serine protease n=1 Tax=Ramlibacter albus TaxID=2079448 RepID=A0A923M5F0_9BURK|nr:trypsin-like peptidase domain-containing protein [Ramlibacter albus]MBC5764161.1 trypsin-like peptidase domain-containing protein [Ramlibacter albus]